MRIFADTSFLVALYDTSDERFLRAHNLLHTLREASPTVLTSDFVFDETMTLLLATHRTHGYMRAAAFDRDITLRKVCQLVFIPEQLFQEARVVFNRYNKDKRWSFTDCTSYMVMKDYGIKKVLTFDHHFTEMGFSLIGDDEL